jgi:hypothetical protein
MTETAHSSSAIGHAEHAFPRCWWPIWNQHLCLTSITEEKIRTQQQLTYLLRLGLNHALVGSGTQQATVATGTQVRYELQLEQCIPSEGRDVYDTHASQPLFGKISSAEFSLKPRIKFSVAGVVFCIVCNLKGRKDTVSLLQASPFQAPRSKCARHIGRDSPGHSGNKTSTRATDFRCQSSDECCTTHGTAPASLAEQGVRRRTAYRDHFWASSILLRTSTQRRKPSPKVPFR